LEVGILIKGKWELAFPLKSFWKEPNWGEEMEFNKNLIKER